MHTVLTKLTIQSSDQLIVELSRVQAASQGAIISFLYFANVMKHDLMREDSAYRTALLASDYLLPDGIALQLFYQWETSGNDKLHNLNGTDFIPAFLDTVYSNSSPRVGLLTVYDESIGKYETDVEKIQTARSERFGEELNYFKHVHYRERNEEGSYEIESIIASADKSQSQNKILILCTGTPHQELRAHKYANQLKDAGMLVFCAGGLIDYIVGVEKRAPQRVVKARVLETFWRVITKPKKNLKKFLIMFKIVPYWWKKYVRGVETI